MLTRPIAASTLALALAGLLPAAAHAAWQPETIPGTEGGLPPALSFAFDRQGQGLALFEGFSQQHSPARFTGTIVRAPGGGWTRGPDIAGVGWGSARAHLYARARALLITRQVTGYGAYNRARFRLAWAVGGSDGTFGALRQISASADVPASAANVSGDALVAYALQGGSTLRVSERPAGRGFGAPRTISPAGAATPAVAMNDRGDRIVAWLRGDRVEARVRRAGHGWGARATVAHVSRSSNESLRAVVSPSGRFALAWEGANVRESRPTVLDAGVGVRTAGGSWRSAVLEHGTLGTETRSADVVAVPVLDSTGALLVAYTGRQGAGTGAKVAAVSSTARVGTPVLLSAPSDVATVDDAAAGPAARVAVTWAVHDPSARSRTFVSLRPGPGAFGPGESLTPADEAGLSASRVAFSPLGGRAVVVRPLVFSGTPRLAADAD